MNDRIMTREQIRYFPAPGLDKVFVASYCYEEDGTIVPDVIGPFRIIAFLVRDFVYSYSEEPTDFRGTPIGERGDDAVRNGTDHFSPTMIAILDCQPKECWWHEIDRAADFNDCLFYRGGTGYRAAMQKAEELVKLEKARQETRTRKAL